MSKRIYKNNYVIFIISIIPALLYSQLKVSLEIDKSEYLTDEPIYFLSTETNISPEIQYTSPFSPFARDYFEFVLIDHSGKRWVYKGPEATYPFKKGSPGQKLLPGEAFYYKANLLGIFGISDSLHGIQCYLPPGNYVLQLKHQTDYDWFLNTKYKNTNQFDMEGSIFSNKVRFSIKAPTGQDEVVHQKLLEIYDWQQRSHFYNNIREEKLIPLVRKFIQRYPNNVYAKAAFEVYAVDPIENIILFKNSIGSLVFITNLGIPINMLLPYSLKFKDSKLAEYVQLLQANGGEIRTNKPVKPANGENYEK